MSTMRTEWWHHAAMWTLFGLLVLAGSLLGLLLWFASTGAV